MDQPAFTARNIAKHIVTAAIATKTSQFAASAITDYTQFEKDDFIVKTGSGIVGWGVSAKLKPRTDAVVDKTADFIAKKRAERAAKKDDTPEQ